MLCRRLMQSYISKPSIKATVSFNLVEHRYFSRKCTFIDSLLAAVAKSGGCTMSSFRTVIKDFSVKRLWSVWTRSFLVNTVFKRIRRDRSLREVIQCFRQTVLRPRRTLFLSTTAAFKSYGSDSENPSNCEQSISDDELEALANELEMVEELSKTTLFCRNCDKRIVIDKKLSGVCYCVCKDAQAQQDSFNGWQPYMEAEDVIIWRKEYKPGQGLYAYKVYGRYKDVLACDFAAVQVDGAYRRVWDAAVAALSVVERDAGGRPDQAVLHWEVIWPRLFANRDYVYIRRHKDFDVKCSAPRPHKELLFQTPPTAPPERVGGEERPSVHSNAKRKAMEIEAREKERGEVQQNKVFVIISRSCEHPQVPESKNAIRVSEYWSHMVVRSLEGVDKPGMEFVLTYYDEPAVGGMPSGVAAWATGRAAPAYLDRMRRAAGDYAAWCAVRENQELPDFVSFKQQQRQPSSSDKVKEEDMESSKDGPDLENGEDGKRDQSTQTEETSTVAKERTVIDDKPIVNVQNQQSEQKNEQSTPKKEAQPTKKDETPTDGDSDKPEEEDKNKTNAGCWWRYLYPMYYFS